MRGKHLNKRRKIAKRSVKGKSHKGLWIALGIAVLIFCGILALIFFHGGSDSGKTGNSAETSEGFEIGSERLFELGNDLSITKIGSYTGAYMEDGSDEQVSDVMMIVITNNGDRTLQYAEVTLSGEAGDAFFKFSTLEPGASVLVLEANRKGYADDDSYTMATAENVVFFEEQLSCHEDVFEIQLLDGGFNITNISNQDITQKIEIYYKNNNAGIYYGGITYRGIIEGGMKAGEIKQIMSSHFSATDTTITHIIIREQ